MNEPSSGRAKHVVMVLTNPMRSDRPDARVSREAKSLASAGYHVTILAWDRDQSYASSEQFDGFQVLRLHTRAAYGSGTGLILPLFRFRRQVRRLLRTLDWDVLHCHDLDGLVACWPISSRANRPIVFDAHESYPDFVAPRVPSVVRFVVGMVERYLVRRVSAVITVGTVLADKYTALGASHVSVVGNWHDPTDMKLSEERRCAVRASLGTQGLLLSYMGHFGRNRALPELVEAVKLRPTVTLVLAGGGNQRAKVETLIAGHPNIVDLGVIPRADALELRAASDVAYRAADTNVGPNAKYSAPNGLFEALAAGVPVIASNNGDLGRIVRETGCGVVLSEISVEAIVQALDICRDREQLRIMGERATEAARTTYNWSEATRRLLAVYARWTKGGSS